MASEHLKELARSYLTITKDVGRVMNLKALYRGWGIPCPGNPVYAPSHGAEWLGKIREAGVRRRAEHYYQQLDALRSLRQEVRRDLLAESKKQRRTEIRDLVLMRLADVGDEDVFLRIQFPFQLQHGDLRNAGDHRKMECIDTTWL